MNISEVPKLNAQVERINNIIVPECRRSYQMVRLCTSSGRGYKPNISVASSFDLLLEVQLRYKKVLKLKELSKTEFVGQFVALQDDLRMQPNRRI